MKAVRQGLFTVELLPLFAEIFYRFCLNRARRSKPHENSGRHFCLGADHHRIRDLFGCSVDALGILSPRTRSCVNGCRQCAQTRLGTKVAREGLAIRQTKDRPEAVNLKAALRWQCLSLNLAICCRDWYFPFGFGPGSERANVMLSA